MATKRKKKRQRKPKIKSTVCVADWCRQTETHPPHGRRGPRPKGVIKITGSVSSKCNDLIRKTATDNGVTIGEVIEDAFYGSRYTKSWELPK